MKDDKEKIVELLLSSGDSTGGETSVIPIVGMGGIGKTTLAQVAYNDERVKKHFDVRAWVTVTEDFDVYSIMETIFGTVCPGHTGHIQELFELQRMLREALSGKRFLIVHDDVWNEDHLLWDKVKGCFGSGAVGSKIVVTTQHEKVASIMAVGPTHYMANLSSEESWELFVKHAFGGGADLSAHRDLEAIGRKIVSKCGGLPLAVKCLGGLLRSERDPLEWESICESDVWDDLLKREANIIPALWQSYRQLPAHLKRCFAYCSMFPKNHKFKVDKMVLWWMAEGFLGTNDACAAKRLEAVGEQYFNDLLSRSLFQRRPGENAVVMHDLVHDLAVIVAGEFGLWIGRTEDACKLTSKTRHVSHNSSSCEWDKSEGLHKVKHLRTFIGLPLQPYQSSQLVPLDLLFTNGSSLRVLSLCNSPITELTESVGNLIHLRHLDLSGTEIEVLPDSVCTLYNLMTLLLSWCGKLTVLPKKMENLISLRQLDVGGVPLKGMEMQIKRMKSLIALNQFLVGDGNRGPKINDLKQIQPIRGRLIISRIENVVDAAEASEANLKDKKLITDLVLRWSSEAAEGASSSEGERNVLDSLRPHTNLSALKIEFYRGTTFPDWVGHSCFTNIVEMRLKNCRSCSSLPPLGQLPSLAILQIRGFDSVVKIGSEFLGNSPSFRCLESLRIENMAELLEWSFGEGVTFPLLHRIEFKKCPKFNISFPSFKCLAFPSLKYLSVDNKGEDLNELLDGDEKGEDWPRLISEDHLILERYLMTEVGVAFLSAFLQLLFDRLASEEVLSLFGGEQTSLELLEELSIRLISVNKLINDQEEKQLKVKEVERWLDNLKDVIYHADDLVDKIDSEVLRRKAEGESNTTRIEVLNDHVGGLHSMVEKEVTRILHTLKLLLDQNKNDSLGLRERNERKSFSKRRSAPLVVESGVYGRKDDKEKIVDLLLSSGDNTGGETSVIPIVGMGGIGKTTLAQLAYNDERVKKHFDVRAWVTVTEDFNVYRITETIFRTVCPGDTGRSKELFELQRMLNEALSGKRFLIVHDDVWNENYLLWDQVKGCFGSGAVGSKIVVTTRHEKVASVMAVGPTHHMAYLSSEESWELFVKHTFGGGADLTAHQDLEAIGRKIVSKCGGLPLAVKRLGVWLRSERDPLEWEKICKSDVWDDLLKREANIILALWLSYRHLPTHLKRCFAYCSMFPKNHEFDVDEMVLWWMAEGFLGTNDDARATESLEAVGEQYFNDLLSRSLFQRRPGENTVVMHDLVHDMAVIVAGEFGLWIGCTEDACKLTSKTRHVSHNRLSCEWYKSEGLCKAKHLRTFIGLPLSRFSSHSQLVPLDLLFRNGRSLRVLSLNNSPITELTKSVENLIHLRHLDLSRTKIEVLPDSVCTLYNLMTLLLSGCGNLTALPKKMENLISLRQLDVEGVPLKDMEMQIKRMKSLIALNQFLVGDGNRGPKINDLKQIQPFRGSLEISRIENVVDAAEALEANLKDKKLVTDLILRWSSEAADGERNVLDSLRPHTNLRFLRIEFYKGTTFPDWVGHSSFTNIISMSLENCKNCSSLPPLGQLPSLKYLWIRGFDSLVKIGSEFLGSSPSFGCLKELRIENMIELLEWSFGEGVTFPLLNHIWLRKCPKLNISFPSFRWSAFPSLGQLTVDKCNDLDELLNGNEKGEAWSQRVSETTCEWNKKIQRN